MLCFFVKFNFTFHKKLFIDGINNVKENTKHYNDRLKVNELKIMFIAGFVGQNYPN